MIFAGVFGLSERTWEVLLIFFVVIPLVCLWVATLVHIVRRQDLPLPQRIVWLVVEILFPLVGTFVYLISQPAVRQLGRRQAAAIEQAADTAGALSGVLDNFAATMSLAQSSLVEGVSLIEDLSDMLARADSTLGFTVPFTRIRPLGPAHAEMRTLGAKSRALGRALGRTADALGTNASDLHAMAVDVSAIAGALGMAPTSPAAVQSSAGEPPPRSGMERVAVSSVQAVHAPALVTPGQRPVP